MNWKDFLEVGEIALLKTCISAHSQQVPIVFSSEEELIPPLVNLVYKMSLLLDEFEEDLEQSKTGVLSD